MADAKFLCCVNHSHSSLLAPNTTYNSLSLQLANCDRA